MASPTESDGWRPYCFRRLITSSRSATPATISTVGESCLKTRSGSSPAFSTFNRVRLSTSRGIMASDSKLAAEADFKGWVSASATCGCRTVRYFSVTPPASNSEEKSNPAPACFARCSIRSANALMTSGSPERPAINNGPSSTSFSIPAAVRYAKIDGSCPTSERI